MECGGQFAAAEQDCWKQHAAARTEGKAHTDKKGSCKLPLARGCPCCCNVITLGSQKGLHLGLPYMKATSQAAQSSPHLQSGYKANRQPANLVPLPGHAACVNALLALELHTQLHAHLIRRPAASRAGLSDNAHAGPAGNGCGLLLTQQHPGHWGPEACALPPCTAAGPVSAA